MTTGQADSRPWRRSVGMMIINRQGQVFAGHKAKHPDHIWEMPQGAIDPGESAMETAWREMAEETGIAQSTARLITVLSEDIRVELPEDLSRRKWRGQYRGEQQTWFLFLLEEENAINIQTADPEYAAWKWVTPDDLTAICLDYRQSAYASIREQFLPELTRLSTPA